MNLRNYRDLCLTVAVVGIMVAACSESEDPVRPSIIDFVASSPDECANGGQTILIGIDDNGDGALQPREVDSRSSVCEGAPGIPGEQGVPGTNALIQTSTEAAGINCIVGGIRIDVGTDSNGDGTLQATEIEATAYACDGSDGEAALRTLVRTSTAVDDRCETGGIRFEFGLDIDDDGMLADTEVQTTEAICSPEDGREALLLATDEPAGANCILGGTRLDSGIDLDRSNALEPDEITETAFVCDLVRTVVRVTAELTGTSTTCASGGSRVETGLDADGDSVLDDDEVAQVAIVCEGRDGERSLVFTAPEPVGARCGNGGTRISAGLDRSGDGTLQPDEVVSVTFACNGIDGVPGTGGNAVRVGPEPVGVNCALGGARIQTGLDSNGNGALDDAEVTNTSFACDSGENAVLVDVIDEAPGLNCANGGRRIVTGVDLDLDRILAPAEITETVFVCDTPSTAVPFLIETAALSDTFDGVGYEQNIAALGGTNGAYTWRITDGVLPAGLTLQPMGTPSTTISGVATSTGTFSFTVEVTDFFGATASKAYTLNVLTAPCAPGRSGMVGVAQTDIPLSTSNIVSAHGIDVDEDPAGWAYIIGLGELQRIRKDGSASEDLEALLGLAIGDLGYEVHVSGPSVYIVDNSQSTTSRRIQRITNDGGQTFAVVDMVTFASAPSDIRGIEVEGDQLYFLTHGSANTQVFRADISGTLPVVPTLLGTIATLASCSGLALDRQFFYTACDSFSVSPDALVRIERTTLTPTLIIDDAPSIDISSTYNAVEQQDLDDDGVADVLWVHGFNDKAYVCSPATATSETVFFNAFGEGADSEAGLALDATAGALYLYDENPDALFRFE